MNEFEIRHFGKELTGRDGITVESNIVFRFPTHLHAYYEMILYEPFDGWVAINDMRFAMDHPTAVLMVPGDFHCIEVNDSRNASYIKIAFDESLLHPKCSLPDSSVLLQLSNQNHFLQTLFTEMRASSPNAEYLTLLAATCAKHLQLHGTIIPSAAPSQKRKLCTEAVRLLNEHFTEDITLVKAAAMLTISPQYLSKIFTEISGISFKEYLLNLRLRRAADLLLSSPLSITEVCFTCGYQNLSHFLRSFKDKYGVSPGNFRSLKQQFPQVDNAPERKYITKNVSK